MWRACSMLFKNILVSSFNPEFILTLRSSMVGRVAFAWFVVVAFSSVTCGLSVSQFYSFGEENGDTQLQRLEFHKLVNLSTPVKFNGEVHNRLFVHSNGAISFDSPLPQENPYGLLEILYPQHERIDKVFYRESRDQYLLLLASAEVHAAFANLEDFEATSLFIVTWLLRKTASFQVVLVSDDQNTFTLFHFNHEIENDILNFRRLFSKSEVKLDSELRKFFFPTSFIDKKFRLSQNSNVNIPGKWVYMTSSHSLDEPVPYVVGVRFRRNAVDVCGESRCSENAVCEKKLAECCVCKPGYYGNGEMCLKEDQSMHMTGKLTGSINGISLDGIRCSVFGDVLSKTTFIALDPVDANVGFLLRILTPLVSNMGFLFAHPGERSVNGFSSLGDKFSRRSRAIFETGEQAKIYEKMIGMDENGFYKFEIEVDGYIPVFDDMNELQFDDYVHTYRYDRLGIMSGFYSTMFSLGGAKQRVSVVEVLEFREVQGCVDVGRSKMAVSEQRSSYDVNTKVLNFALKTEMQDEEACGQENQKCHRQAKCIVEDGVQFCTCNIGFEGDGLSCQDVDECELNIHDCSSNADCKNNLGSYNCQCRDGFIGNGRTCIKEEGRCGAEAKLCHSLAQCITGERDDSERCECNIGYTGDGVSSCEDANECSLGIDDCSVNADCINIPSSYQCRCKDGYTGDGRTCRKIAVIGSGEFCSPDGAECDPTEECVEGRCQCRIGFLLDGFGCKDADECVIGIHTCDKDATCSNTVGSFKCTCNDGYFGDGYKCTSEAAGCHGKDCHDNAYCDRSRQVPVCKCNVGYKGDGVSCEDIDECEDDESSCHDYAICSNTVGSYSCQCRPGYLGDGQQCIYDNPCKDLACGFNARCLVRNDIPRCQCYPGYYGNGQTCLDYNECETESDFCDRNAKCVNTLGSYRCFCLPGYHGDGYSCKSDGSCGGSKCHRNAECRDVDGAKQCRCKNGFEGSGLICQDFDECSNASLVQCPEFSRCFNTPGSYQCRCDPGYEWNGVECKAVCLRCLNGGQCLKSGCLCREGYSGDRCQWVGDEFLVFTQGSTMQRLSLPPRQNTIGVLLQTTRGLLVALDFDHMNKMIYFTDVAQKAIWRVRFNGTGVEKIISEGLSSPEGIAVDYVGGNLYWTDSMFDRVEVAKLNGSDRRTLFSTRLINPRSMVVHPEKGTMYWADWNRAAPKIEVANMDGGSRRVFVQHNMGLPNGLTLDRRNDELCWTDAMHQSISCANLDEGRPKVVYDAARYPFGVTSFGQYLIWTDWDARAIQQYDRNDYKLKQVIHSVPGSSGAFYEIKAVQEPQKIDSHGCNKNNGGCSNLCLPKPGGHTCACANGFYLVSKEESLKLKSLGSGSGAGSGSIAGSGPIAGSGSGSGLGSSVSKPNLGSGSGVGAGSGVGSGSGSGFIPEPTVVPSFNSTSSNETVCIGEETYKLLRNLS